MLDMFYEALVGVGELTLIMLVSALVIWLGYVVKQVFFGKSCDKK